MRDLADIVDTYRARRVARGPLVEQMIAVRDAYNGDIAVPMPELGEGERAAVPNLVGQGLDQMGMRVASVRPDIFCAPTKPGQQRSEDMAGTRRKVLLGWWEANKMGLLLRLRSRWALGYACSPVMIRPSRKLGCPEWQVRDPLTTYPAPVSNLTVVTPDDCIFAVARTWGWLDDNYEAAAAMLRRPPNTRRDDRVTVIEYVDDAEITLIALSRGGDGSEPLVIDAAQPPYRTDRPRWTAGRPGETGTEDYVALERLANRAGICTAVVPGRITLDREQGQYDGILGMYQAQAMLFALEFQAVVRGVWPDQWLVGRPGEDPKIITVADGPRGEIGKISGGDLATIVTTPGYLTNPTRDYLERNQRITAGIPAEFGGEAGSNIRTGRRGDMVLSATIDYTIQEAQEIFSASLNEENVRAIAVAKAYFGNTPRSFHVSRREGRVDYVPNKVFDTDQNLVSYPYPGADVNNLTIGLGQLLGLEMVSSRTAMEIHPFVDDPEAESDRITSESLLRALKAAIEQQAATGAIPPADVARIAMLVQTNRMSLPEAVETVQREAQERQASSGAPGEPDGPVDPLSPEAQPGIAQPGAGAEAGAAIAEPTPSMQNLNALLGNLFPAEAAGRRASATVG